MTDTAEVTVRATGLTKRFGARTAVADLSFAACSGEVVGLLGRNGAGKTTTVRLLTTVLRPSAGTFEVAGVPPNRPRDIRRVVGVLPESAGFPARQTGREYLRYFGRLYGLAPAAAANAAERLLGEVGLADRAHSLVGTYSRGMRQRLGIARALVNDPLVVFLDEPTLGLDPDGHRDVLALVREIAERRRATVLLSTHTLPDVEDVCSTVLILNEGRLVLDSPIGAISGRLGDVFAATTRAGGA
jgi:ABC-2 type transport system ATP-binding protein